VRRPDHLGPVWAKQRPIAQPSLSGARASLAEATAVAGEQQCAMAERLAGPQPPNDDLNSQLELVGRRQNICLGS